VLQPIFIGAFYALATGAYTSTLGAGFPSFVLALLIGAVLSVVALVTTRRQGPPVYFWVRSLMIEWCFLLLCV
jgi:hypothetical protein